MDDMGLNQWLKDTYGTTVDGYPLFRLLWTTNVTERRHSKFVDFHEDLFIREVEETREVLKYPFAQDRWVLERIHLIDNGAINIGLRADERFAYEEVYTFQDRDGNYLPLNREAIETAMYLFFKYYLALTPLQRQDMRVKMLADKDRRSRDLTRDSLGDGQAAHSFVLESLAGMGIKRGK
jgi:hypothetical protein